MKKENLVKAISETTKVSPDVVSRVLESFRQHLLRALTNGDSLILQNFGVFKLVKRKAKSMQNFHTGERFVLPEHMEPKLVFCKNFVRKIREKA